MRFAPKVRRRRDVLHGRPEDGWRELIATHAHGRSFIDVGCIWNVHGGYAFHALDHGSGPVTGMDVIPPTPDFLAENSRRGNPVRFVQADVNDPRITALVGQCEVVFCSGVLYHVPDPLHTISQLRRISSELLILTSFIIPEQELAQSAIYLPYLDAKVRASLSFQTPRNRKRGLDTDFEPDKDYGNWFWGLSASCIRALLTTAGFEVLEFLEHRYVGTALCRISGTTSRAPARPA